MPSTADALAQFKPEEKPETVAEQVARLRPRSLRMQLRYIRGLIFSFWLFGRLIFWQVYVGQYFPRWIIKTNTGRLRQYAREFRHFAVRMGGVMIKLGQFASTRADVLPEEVIRELESLQDEVPSIAFKKIRKVLVRDFPDIYERFDWIKEEPIAAASLGQVHRAKLKDGDRVVIKVQRPGIRDIVYTDLATLFIVARVAMRFRFINRRADMIALSEEFGRVLLEEISYEKEADNAKRFMKMFEKDMGVYIPSVYTEHSTDEILTIEDVTSLKINDFEALEAKGIDRKEVARRLMDTYMRQIFEVRYFHADPHPGNLFVYPLPVEDESQYIGKGGRPFYLIFVDFGMTGTLTKELRQGLIDTLSAVITRNPGDLIAAYRDLGFILPNADLRPIEEAARIAFDQVWGLSVSEMQNIDFDVISDIGQEFNELLYDMPFRVPQDFVYLGRTVGILTGICTALDPNYNPWIEIQHYMQRFLVDDDNDALKQIGSAIMEPFNKLVSGGPAAFFEETQKMLNPKAYQNEAILLSILNGETEIVSKPNKQYRRQLDRIETQGKRTTRAMVFGSFFIASTMFYTNGDIQLAVIGYTVSGVTFLAMISAKSS